MSNRIYLVTGAAVDKGRIGEAYILANEAVTLKEKKQEHAMKQRLPREKQLVRILHLRLPKLKNLGKEENSKY